MIDRSDALVGGNQAAPSSVLIPMHVDIDTFRRFAGGAFNDYLFHSHAIGGIISRDKLIELSLTTDVFLSFDNDCYDRMYRMNIGLRTRGLSTSHDESVSSNINQMCDRIDKARSIVICLTQKYLHRLQNGKITDKCQQEFNYAMRRKHQSLVMILIMEPALLNYDEWFPSMYNQINNNTFIANFSSDDLYESACDSLFQRFVRVRQNSVASAFVESSSSGSVDAHRGRVVDHAQREETQFSQWMARSTRIHESRRIVYCAALVKLGVSSVQKLAKRMKDVPSFLTSIGLLEYDADEIALAISDLGLGYQPVRDFTGATSIDSATYALKKTVSAPDDHELAANALMCVCKIAESGPDAPMQMCELGFGDAIIKVMINHLSDSNCVISACKALLVFASSSPELNEMISNINPSPGVVIPKGMLAHIKNVDVIEISLKVVAKLSENANNKIKLSIGGICDVLVKALTSHVAQESVCEYGIFCITNLCEGNYENIGKLGKGAVEIIRTALTDHSSNRTIIEQAFKAIVLIAVDPEIRTIWGRVCPEAIVKAFAVNIDDAAIAQQACFAIHSILVGSSYNRNIMGQAGACEVIRAAFERFIDNPDVLYHACIAIYSLAAGSPQNAVKFDGLARLLKVVVCSSMNEKVTGVADEAMHRVK